MKPSPRRTNVEDLFIDLRVQLSPDASADLRVPHDVTSLLRPALRVPIRARTQPVGSLRLVGPRAGDCTREDEQRLAAFADEVGVAYGEFLLRERSRHDATWRQVRTGLGIGLTVIGLLLVLAAAWALGARALPPLLAPVAAGRLAGRMPRRHRAAARRRASLSRTTRATAAAASTPPRGSTARRRPARPRPPA